MTWIDFMSQFGGNCGLCLGISLLSVVEIFYWFSVKLCKNFKTWGGRDNFLARFLSSAIMPIFYLCLHICLGFSKLCQTVWWNLNWIGCKWSQVFSFYKISLIFWKATHNCSDTTKLHMIEHWINMYALCTPNLYVCSNKCFFKRLGGKA